MAPPPVASTTVVDLGQVVDRLLLALPESVFAFVLEDGRDIDAGAALDLVVGIAERHAERLGELLADRGFAGPIGPIRKCGLVWPCGNYGLAMTRSRLRQAG